MNKIEDTIQEEKIIGKFKPKEKLIEFVGGRGNIQFIANEAVIEGKYLSGLDLEDVKFKLTICNEGTVNFDEVETTRTTEEQRGRLLDVIFEKTISNFNKKMVVTELPFKSVKEFNNKLIDLYLVVEYQTPISKLSSFFDDDIIISDDQDTKLNDLLSLFGDEEVPLEEEIQEVITIENVPQQAVDNTTQQALKDSFGKMKEDKIVELKNRLSFQEKELSKFEYEKKQAEQRIETTKTDIKVLESRITSLKPIEDSNGYYFNVSEQQNEKSSLDEATTKLIFDKISKVKSINAEAFMKLFEDGEYQIRIGQKIDDVVVEVTDYSSIIEDVKKTLRKRNINLRKKFYLKN